MSGRRVALVVNPTAGRGRARACGDVVAARLASAGFAVHDASAATAAAAASAAAQAVAAGIDALVVVGGDGAVHLGLNAVAGTSTPLGIVAAGSGNDVARSLHLPVHAPAAAADVLLSALARGSTRTLDAVRWTGSQGSGWYGAVLAAGFDALVNERANGWTWPRGRLRYNLAIARELPVLRARRYRIRVDESVLDVDALLVAVANTPSYGGGMRVAPDARVDDGLLDVVVLGAVGKVALARLYPKVFSGAHIGHRQVTVLRGRSVEVDAAGIVGYADGERLGLLPLTCRSVPGAFRVLTEG